MRYDLSLSSVCFSVTGAEKAGTDGDECIIEVAEKVSAIE